MVHTSTHGTLTADVVVTAAGFRTSLPIALVPDGGELTIDVDATLRVDGHTDMWACGGCITFPHPRLGRIDIPHWDHARHSGRHAADSIMGDDVPYTRDPYFFSDIGPLRIQQVGRDGNGDIAAILFLNAPGRLAKARALLATTSSPNEGEHP